MDQLTLQRIQLMHPNLRTETETIYKEIVAALTGRATVRFSYTLRTFAEQDALFKQRPQVTKAKGGQSYHNYGLALDIVLLKDTDNNGTFETASWETKVDFDGDGKADWKEIVDIFKAHGWEWGGEWQFKDDPHFQKIGQKHWKDLLAQYNAKDFIPGTTYVKL